MPRQVATGRSTASNRLAVQDMKSSLSFNGTSTTVSTTIVPDITGFNIAFWYNPSSSVANARVVDSQASGPIKGFTILQATGVTDRLAFRGSNNSDFVFSARIPAGRLPYGVWSHIVCTYNGTSGKIYQNGQLVESSDGAVTATTEPLEIGKRVVSGSNYAAMKMSGVVIKNGLAFTQKEITALYNGTIPTGATAVYKLDEGAGSTAYDSSGNGNHGTITNGTFTSDVPTKKRQEVNGNLVYNGDFEYAPVGGVPTTSGFNWIDGTADGSITNGIFGWQVINRLGTTSIYFDNTVSKSGSNSLKISLLAAGSWGGIGNTSAAKNSRGIGSGQPSIFTVLPNTSYTISLYMKTQHHSGTSDTGAICQVINYTAGGSSVGSALNVMNGVLSTTDWTKYSLTFTTPSTASFLQILPRIIGSNGAGTLIMDAWFDDIVLKPTTPTTRTAV